MAKKLLKTEIDLAYKADVLRESKKLLKIVIDLDYGEASMKESKRFKKLNPLLKADVLRDLKGDFDMAYDKACVELENYFKSIIT